MTETPGHDALHLWFSLSYANYLVLPRSFLQSMPDEWQGKLAALLHEADEAAMTRDFCWPPDGLKVYVELRRDEPRIRDDLADYQRGRRRLWNQISDDAAFEVSSGGTNG